MTLIVEMTGRVSLLRFAFPTGCGHSYNAAIDAAVELLAAHPAMKRAELAVAVSDANMIWGTTAKAMARNPTSETREAEREAREASIAAATAYRAACRAAATPTTTEGATA